VTKKNNISGIWRPVSLQKFIKFLAQYRYTSNTLGGISSQKKIFFKNTIYLSAFILYEGET
jgi:hypothetical protein